MNFRKQLYLIGLLGSSLSGWAQTLTMEFTQTIPTTGKAHSITVAHLNNDAFADLVVLTNDALTEAKIYMGKEDETFEATTPLSKGENYGILDHGDFNDDGFDDLVISSYWNNGFKIFWGSSHGDFTEGIQYNLTGHGKNVKVQDLNNDGALDIAALSGGSGQPITLHVYHGNNDQSFSLQGVYGSVLDTDRRITIVDKNNDGLPDVMVTSSFPWFVIFYQQTDGSFIPRYWPFTIELPFPTNYLLADLNGDEKQDIIAQYWEGEFRFFEGGQDTLFSSSYSSIPAPAGMSRVYAVDLNLDGRIDLVANKYNERTDEPSDSLFIFLNTGDFTFAEPQLLQFPDAVEYYIVEDLNNDQFPEIAASCKGIGIVIASNADAVLTNDPKEPASLISFPNPFTDRLIIRTSEPSLIMVYSNQGQLLQSAHAYGELELQTSTWPKGTLHVKTLSEKGVVWQKIFKQ